MNHLILIYRVATSNDFTVTHLPPLAYSITRYKVFSVSITSKSLTGGGERDKDRGLESEGKVKRVEMGQQETERKGRSSANKRV